MAPTAIYLRISHDPDGLRAGVDRQRADCLALAARKGWGNEVVFYEDNDRSAYRGKRPEWERLLRDIPRLHAVLAYDMDRLVRQPRDLERFLDACEAARMVRVATAQGDIDLTSHDGQLQARILAAVAKKASDDTSRRTRRAALDRAEQGRWHGGPPPFGYHLLDGSLEPSDEALGVARAARAVLDGTPLSALHREFGGPTSAQGWKYLLTRPALVGRTRTGHPAQWPAILPLDLWLALQAHLSDPSRLTHRGTELRRWLTGVAVCGHDGAGLRGHSAHGKSKYRCKVCTLTIDALALEGFITGAILEAAPRQETLVQRVESPPPEQGVADRLAELAVLYAHGDLTRAEWEAARRSVSEIRTETTAPQQISHMPTSTTWPAMSPGERRRVARWLFDRIVILPMSERGRLIEDRVEFVWRR